MRTVFRCIVVLVVFAVSFLPTMVNARLLSPSPGEVNEFEMLMDKIRADFAGNPSIDEYLTKYNAVDGSFTDIDYSRTDRTNWEPLIHIDRV